MATDSESASANFLSEIASLCEEWNRAEEWIKRCETINGEVLMPSINELRYAGRRIVDACQARHCNDTETARTHIAEARQNLIKARHDVVDAIVAFISDGANERRRRLGADNLQKHFSEYGALFGLLKTMLETTALSRADRTRRDEMYETMMSTDLPRLQNLYRAMEESLPAIERNIKKEKERNFYFLLFGIAGFVVGVIGLIF